MANYVFTMMGLMNFFIPIFFVVVALIMFVKANNEHNIKKVQNSVEELNMRMKYADNGNKSHVQSAFNDNYANSSSYTNDGYTDVDYEPVDASPLRFNRLRSTNNPMLAAGSNNKIAYRSGTFAIIKKAVIFGVVVFVVIRTLQFLF